MMRLFSKEAPESRFTKLVLLQAVQEKATKVLFGELVDKVAERIPHKPSWPGCELPKDTPWDTEERERFSGRSDESRTQEKAEEWQELLASMGPTIPLWFKVGNTPNL